MKRELLKKYTKASGVVESRDQTRIDSLLTYNGHRLRLTEKDHIINLTMGHPPKEDGTSIFTRYFMISYRMAIFLLISKIHTFIFM